MTEFEIMSLAYQRKSAGDGRTIAAIVTATKADIEKNFSPQRPASDDVVGESHICQPDGTMKHFKHMGDGSKVEV